MNKEKKTTKKRVEKNAKTKKSLSSLKSIGTFNKKHWYIAIGVAMVSVFIVNVLLLTTVLHLKKTPVKQAESKSHWFMLHRKSQVELLYFGKPGDAKQSELVKTFQVKVGIPGERPTPLPKLAGREYWVIASEEAQFDNPETAPYFLTLNIPVPSVEPYGPSPYTECNGEQCNWILPGAFGLHGTASDSSKLAPENPGSSGCIRHSDTDITYLYNLLDPQKEEIRYYVEDK